MFKDAIGAHDLIAAAIDNTVVAPKHPCPVCGRESKEHNKFIETDGGPELVPGSRICSNKACRQEFNILD